MREDKRARHEALGAQAGRSLLLRAVCYGLHRALMSRVQRAVERGARALQGLQERLAPPIDAAGVDRERLMLA